MSVTLEIGSIVVPTAMMLEFDQRYSEIKSETSERTAGGILITRRLYGQGLATRIDARGWSPSPFKELTKGVMYTIKCASPDSATSATTTVTLPAGRRSDAGHEPVGLALVDGRFVETAITNLALILAGATDDALLESVAGAGSYWVDYFPQIDAKITAHECKGDRRSNFTWSLEAEQEQVS